MIEGSQTLSSLLVTCSIIAAFGASAAISVPQYAVRMLRPLLIICSIAGAILGGTIVVIFMALSLIGGILCLLIKRSDEILPAPVFQSAVNGGQTDLTASRSSIGQFGKSWLIRIIGVVVVSLGHVK